MVGSGTVAVNDASPVAIVPPAGAEIVIFSVKEKFVPLKAADEQVKDTEAVTAGPALQSGVPLKNSTLPGSTKAAKAVVVPAPWLPLTRALHPEIDPFKPLSETWIT